MPQSQRIAALAATLESDLIRMRRDLHRHPELAFAESRTAAIIADQMTRIGAQVRTEVGGTGVLADLQGGQPGPILLIRAEMDALPVGEATGLDYESHAPGIMHACGQHTSPPPSAPPRSWLTYALNSAAPSGSASSPPRNCLPAHSG